MPEQVIISPATADDIPAILALQKLAYQSEAALYDDYAIPPLTQLHEDIQAEFLRSTFLKATVEHRLVGSVRAYQENDTCHIGRLIVLPEYQRKGIGTKLMYTIEKEFEMCKRFELFTGSKSELNIKLYERMGYRIFKKQNLTKQVEIVFMEKC